MGIAIPSESEWGKELARWNTPRNRFIEDINGEPLLDRNGQRIAGLGAVGIEPYPKMLYKAAKNQYGKTLVLDIYPAAYLFTDMPMFDRACAEVDAFNRRNCLKVASEEEHRKATREGWRDSPQEALDAAEALERAIADAAAEAAAAVRGMSAQARAEFDAAGQETHQHVTDIIGGGKAGKARGVVADAELDGRERELRRK